MTLKINEMTLIELIRNIVLDTCIRARSLYFLKFYFRRSKMMSSNGANTGGPLYFIEDTKTKKIPKNEITINLKQDFKANSHDIIGR